MCHTNPHLTRWFLSFAGFSCYIVHFPVSNAHAWNCCIKVLSSKHVARQQKIFYRQMCCVCVCAGCMTRTGVRTKCHGTKSHGPTSPRQRNKQPRTECHKVKLNRLSIVSRSTRPTRLHRSTYISLIYKKAQLTQGLRATAPSFQDGRQPPSWILSNRK